MRTRIYSWLAILGGLLSFQGSCNQNCEWRYENDYVRLIIPYQLFPVADTMFVGDTLQLEMDFSEELQVHGHQNKIRFDNFDFSLAFSISEVSGEEENHSTSFIEVIPSEGDVSVFDNEFTGSVFYYIRPVEQEDRYIFKMQLVLQRPGLFMLLIGSSLDDRFISHPLLTRCENGRGDRVSQVFIEGHNEYGSYENINFLNRQAGVSYFPDTVRIDDPPVISLSGVRVLAR